jgi:hypothetical protein
MTVTIQIPEEYIRDLRDHQNMSDAKDHYIHIKAIVNQVKSSELEIWSLQRTWSKIVDFSARSK